MIRIRGFTFAVLRDTDCYPKPMTAATKKLPTAVLQARRQLRIKGWTQGAAAKRLGVTRTHLSLVLNARRESQRLLAEIPNLPEHPTAR